MSGDREASVAARRAASSASAITAAACARRTSAIASPLLQRDGAIVAMVGDGINDAPSLAQADVSLSLGSAATLTQWTADIVVLGDDLGRIA